jgi:hypothetical protein
MWGSVSESGGVINLSKKRFICGTHSAILVGMDMWLVIEFLELMSAIFYLLMSRGKYENRLTQGVFMLIILCLAIDIFVFHRQRPETVKWILNAPTVIYCYEKIYRKYAVLVSRKMAAIVLLPFD